MRNSLIALAVLSTSGAAMAQSSVTMFGVVDAGIGHVRSTGSGSVTGLISGGNATSRLGIRGVEDLGGGLKAGFWLEGALNNDVGGGASQSTGLDFARRSTLSLSGGFGELRMGRDFAASYLPMLSFDPFAGRGLGSLELYGVAAAGANGMNGTTRVSNSIAYFLPPQLGGLYGSVQYAFGERSSGQQAIANNQGLSSSASNAVTSSTGNYLGVRIGYKHGALDMVATYGLFADAVRSVSGAFYADDYKVGNVAAAYDWGVLKLMAVVQMEKIDGRAGLAASQMNSYSLGATAPMGAGLWRAALSRYDLKHSGNDANKLALGYVHNLSKRTAWYADVARIKSKGSASYGFTALGGSLPLPKVAQGGSSTGIAVGIKHSF